MKALLPDAMFIGFTGTPLLRIDKQTSIEVWGPFIHTYKYNEAVEDEVIVDLRYEARDIDQAITSQDKIDQWFEAKTRGLNDLAKAQLKKRWGTMRRVLSSRDRLGKIANDIMMDFARVPRLNGGLGNALLVTDSIYSACKVYEQFSDTDFKNKCAIVTSYRPTPSDIKGEESGEGLTEKLRQYEIYRRMLAAWFNEPEDVAATKIEQFEEEVKKKFVKEPGQMKLLIVVDKLLTGFDAPPATYLYIDKQMRDHGLFQAICRVNRRDGEDKDYGYVIDYKDLFKSLETAFKDYTSGALDGYAKEDVAGLLKDRLAEAREELEEKREAIKALCEPVDPPKDTQAFIRYFCANDSGNDTQLKENESKRLALYKTAAAFLRAFTNLANELEDAGYHSSEADVLRNEGDYYSKVRDEVRLASGDYIDLKMYEPAMRHLLDTYIRAEDSRKVSAFDDLSLIELIVQRGATAIDSLPESIRSDEKAVAETIENNVRRLIIDESPVNPKYYERMSELLDSLIAQRRVEALKYAEYLNQVVELVRKAHSPSSDRVYPSGIDTIGKRALFDNLENDADLALAVDAAARASIQDEWRSHPVKLKKVKLAVTAAVNGDESLAEDIVKLLMRHDREY